MAMRVPTATRSPTARLRAAMVSTQKRARFSNEPPQRSVRLLYIGCKNWVGSEESEPITST